MSKLFLCVYLAVAAAAQDNSIYLGKDVTWTNTPGRYYQMAVSIDQDGTVTVFKGAEVPFISKDGRPVIVRRVVVKSVGADK